MYTYERHWIVLLRIRISYLLGLSGPQTLDSYRLEKKSRGTNQVLSLTGYESKIRQITQRTKLYSEYSCKIYGIKPFQSKVQKKRRYVTKSLFLLGPVGTY